MQASPQVLVRRSSAHRTLAKVFMQVRCLDRMAGGRLHPRHIVFQWPSGCRSTEQLMTYGQKHQRAPRQNTICTNSVVVSAAVVLSPCWGIRDHVVAVHLDPVQRGMEPDTLR